VGSVIHDRYRIEKLLGKGGSGAVYLVQDQRVQGNLFALKEAIDPTEEERERFVFEGNLLKRLDHPALLHVYRAFDDRQLRRSYMLMDFVDGPNLEKTRLQQPEKRFALADTLQLMAPIFAAVTYLHGQQPPILHRDIKPANIIVHKDTLETVLIDLGIAKIYDDQQETRPSVYRGSPGYAAPEQYAHGTNPRTDVYGLAATCYALLAGVVPVDAFSRIIQLNNQSIDPLEPLDKIVPTLPEQVAHAIMRGLALDGDARFATIAEFWQGILEALPEDLAALPCVLAPLPPLLAKEPQASTISQQKEDAPQAGAMVEQAEEEPEPAETLAQAEEEPEFEDEEISQALEAAEARVTTVVYPAVALRERIAVAHSSRGRRPAAVLLLLSVLTLVVLAGSVVGTSFLARMQPHTTTKLVAVRNLTVQPTPTHPAMPTPRIVPTTPASPAVPASYPQLESLYQGQISDQFTSPPTNSTMGLTIRQAMDDARRIKGFFVVGMGLIGSGNFIGSVTEDGQVQFLVESHGSFLPLLFIGTIQSDGSIQGMYCSARQLAGSYQCDKSAGGYGTWLVGKNAA
jgi:eukaryotic-like serine/threonine-protein kinase